MIPARGTGDLSSLPRPASTNPRDHEEVKTSLKAVLKRLKLSGMVPTLPDRAAYAQKTSFGALDFLELALQDEIDRRENRTLSTRPHPEVIDA